MSLVSHLTRSSSTLEAPRPTSGCCHVAATAAVQARVRQNACSQIELDFGCRGGDSNPYALVGPRILSPPRLPFRHPGERRKYTLRTTARLDRTRDEASVAADHAALKRRQRGDQH